MKVKRIRLRNAVKIVFYSFCLILGLRRKRQADFYEFKASLVYRLITANSRTGNTDFKNKTIIITTTKFSFT